MIERVVGFHRGRFFGKLFVFNHMKETKPNNRLVADDAPGAPAVPMLVALFIAALVWNVGTWWFGLCDRRDVCRTARSALTGWRWPPYGPMMN
jgi:hypothetical protein